MFCYQVKLRRALPTWLFEWLKGIVGTARSVNKIGILVMKRPGMKDRDALVVLQWADWCDLHGS